MDQITHEVRLMKWKSVVEACNSRPEGMSARQWLKEQGIKSKTYYYWQRKVRQEAYGQMQQQAALPAVQEDADITFAEPVMPEQTEPAAKEKLSFHADAVIQAGKFTIGLSNSASQPLIRKILEGVSHAG